MANRDSTVTVISFLVETEGSFRNTILAIKIKSSTWTKSRIEKLLNRSIKSDPDLLMNIRRGMITDTPNINKWAGSLFWSRSRGNESVFIITNLSFLYWTLFLIQNKSLNRQNKKVSCQTVKSNRWIEGSNCWTEIDMGSSRIEYPVPSTKDQEQNFCQAFEIPGFCLINWPLSIQSSMKWATAFRLIIELIFPTPLRLWSIDRLSFLSFSPTGLTTVQSRSDFSSTFSWASWS